jgi:hypothetical protein
VVSVLLWVLCLVWLFFRVCSVSLWSLSPSPLGVSVCVLDAVGCSGCETRLFSVLKCLFLSQKVLNCRHSSCRFKWRHAGLTEKIEFQGRLERGNRVQVPKPIRQKYAFDGGHVLKVSVRVPEAHTNWQDFYAHIDKSGRITIPKLTISLLQDGAEVSLESFVGTVFDVSVESS